MSYFKILWEKWTCKKQSKALNLLILLYQLIMSLVMFFGFCFSFVEHLPGTVSIGLFFAAMSALMMGTLKNFLSKKDKDWLDVDFF